MVASQRPRNKHGATDLILKMMTLFKRNVISLLFFFLKQTKKENLSVFNFIVNLQQP